MEPNVNVLVLCIGLKMKCGILHRRGIIVHSWEAEDDVWAILSSESQCRKVFGNQQAGEMKAQGLFLCVDGRHVQKVQGKASFSETRFVLNDNRFLLCSQTLGLFIYWHQHCCFGSSVKCPPEAVAVHVHAFIRLSSVA